MKVHKLKNPLITSILAALSIKLDDTENKATQSEKGITMKYGLFFNG